MDLSLTCGLLVLDILYQLQIPQDIMMCCSVQQIMTFQGKDYEGGKTTIQVELLS